MGDSVPIRLTVFIILCIFLIYNPECLECREECLDTVWQFASDRVEWRVLEGG